MGFDNRGTILYTSLQVVAYADDVDTVTRTLQKHRETFVSLSEGVENMGLTMNNKKIKNNGYNINRGKKEYYSPINVITDSTNNLKAVNSRGKLKFHCIRH